MDTAPLDFATMDLVNIKSAIIYSATKDSATMKSATTDLATMVSAAMDLSTLD